MVQVRLSEQGRGTRMELRFVFASREHMQRLERRGAFEVFPPVSYTHLTLPTTPYV